MESGIEISIESSKIRITPIVPLTIANSNLLLTDLIGDTKESTCLELDISRAELYDSYLIIMIDLFKEYCTKHSLKFELIADEKKLSFIKAMTPAKPYSSSNDKISFWYNYFTITGEFVSQTVRDLINLLEFIGDITIGIAKALVKPKLLRWKDFPTHFTNAGVNAVPITILIVFLIGVISGYQGALQLSQFGADIYLADLIGISITRELSPLMVAIIVAGRSGAAYSAEIGTMKVSEEVDALTTMGFDRITFLVLPRVLAVAFAMPILVLICDVAGIAGGLLAGLASLDITISSFLNQLNIALSYWDVFSGVVKSVVFGLLIATIGCFRGFQVRGGAESVGRYTTSAVVTSVFLIILVDAVFVFILQSLGI